ncbi:MAG: peroxiredoxin family protein [Alphaproteobacteria bacterium]
MARTAARLGAGDRLPNVTLAMADGSTRRLPGDLTSRFCVILFYRGYWCPISRRQLDAFQSFAPKLGSLGATILAASADPYEKAQEVAATLSFPVAHGVSREVADAIGAWWDADRGIVQPAEFVIGPDRTIRSATYSTGAIGRIDPADVVSLVQLLAARPSTNA